jgi:DNA-binding transcriptional LysR family regulator
MQWDELEIFLVVAELGGFTRAAEHLDRPKSSISRAIAALEQRLGERLFERSSRTVRLTDAGHDLQRQARPLVTQLNDILYERQALSKQPRGLLRIATTYELATLGLADLLPDVLSAFPEVNATVDLIYTFVEPIEGGYDVVLWMSMTPLPDSSIVARRMYDVAFGLYATPAMIRRLGFPASLEDVATWPTIAATRNQVWKFRHADTGALHEWHTTARLVVPAAQVRFNAAERGLGVAVLPSAMCEEAVAQRRLVRILPEYRPIPITVYALMPSNRIVPRRVTVLLDAISKKWSSAHPH